jgi:hypothetical protein
LVIIFLKKLFKHLQTWICRNAEGAEDLLILKLTRSIPRSAKKFSKRRGKSSIVKLVESFLKSRRKYLSRLQGKRKLEEALWPKEAQPKIEIINLFVEEHLYLNGRISQNNSDKQCEQQEEVMVEEEKEIKGEVQAISLKQINMTIEYNALIAEENSQKFHLKGTFLTVKISKRKLQ